MRIVTVYPHGLTMGTPNMAGNKTPSLRGSVQGWSQSATRRNIAFLRSADEQLLNVSTDGELLVAISLTLTVRKCPATSDEWHKLRRAFLMRLQRLGLVRSHWVTEWQRRGVPHLHGAFWFPMPADKNPDELIGQCVIHWLALTWDAYGARPQAQHWNVIFDTIGWFKYLAKHASRGVSHYQRSSDSIPDGWKNKTGRVWGHTGEWPLVESEKIQLTDPEFFRYRRIVRSWRKADARASNNRFRIKTARTMLKDNHAERSKLRGVSEWIPSAAAHMILDVTRAITEPQNTNNNQSAPSPD